ncbi:MAG: hypothetical protein HY215_09460 [Candidatus Rokubacteria bacterium]|nr:hypothetical protein [Candidatus Rokubacteria bacterium]
MAAFAARARKLGARGLTGVVALPLLLLGLLGLLRRSGPAVAEDYAAPERTSNGTLPAGAVLGGNFRTPDMLRPRRRKSLTRGLVMRDNLCNLNGYYNPAFPSPQARGSSRDQ